MKKEKVSIARHSLLRKFNILFAASSLIPFLILFSFYTQLEKGKIEVSQGEFFKLLAGVGLASLFCFLEMRRLVMKLVFFVQGVKFSLSESSIDKNTLLELTREKGEIGELAKVFGDILERLEENIKNLEETRSTLYRVLSKIGKAVTSAEDFGALTQLTLETIVEALGAERGFIFSFEDSKLMLKACKGIEKEKVQQTAVKEEINWVVKEQKPLFIPLLEDMPGEKEEIFALPLIICPLVFREKVWGVICLSGKKDKANFSEDDVKILSNLAYQIAISFENVKLNKDIEKSYFETIAALALAVEARDAYSRGHSERVMKYAVKIGERLGLDSRKIQTLRDAARLHDIGKIGMADSILKKEGPLSPEERAMVCKHPVIGETIVKPLKTFAHLLGPIRHHHEFLDGSGYPDGLKGEQIDIVTRILTIVDVFDALTSNRPYRKALNIEEAKKEMKSLVDNNKLDGRIVEVLFELIKEGKLP